MTKWYFDWPGYPASVYKGYWETFDRIGLCTSIQDMLDWVFFAFDKYGVDDRHIEEASTNLYFALESRLPRDHEPEYVIELIRELMGLMWLDFKPIYSFIASAKRKIRLGPVTHTGFYLVIIEEHVSS